MLQSLPSKKKEFIISGQTFSGKTYTMGSDTTDWSSESAGIIPRVIADLFDHLKVK